jgi:hypothetical protein
VRPGDAALAKANSGPPNWPNIEPPICQMLAHAQITVGAPDHNFSWPWSERQTADGKSLGNPFELPANVLAWLVPTEDDVLDLFGVSHPVTRWKIEAGLALGAEPAVTVSPFVQSAVYASLLPRLDMLKSLGLVWIPGVMAGMVVSGASAVYAGIYQFIIVAMILSASGIAGLVVTVLLRSRAFSGAEQLILRPGLQVPSPLLK